MKQPIKKKLLNKTKEVLVHKKKVLKSKKAHPNYGTSKLEKEFAINFLDKNNIKYIYEYEAKDIKRFYDFAIVSKKAKYITEDKEGLTSIIQGIQHTPIDCLIEIDGGYWHSDPRVVDENNLNKMQKHNKMVDELKNKWAILHGIPLIRIWEYDIHHNPHKVLEELSKYIAIPKPRKNRRVMKLK